MGLTLDEIKQMISMSMVSIVVFQYKDNRLTYLYHNDRVPKLFGISDEQFLETINGDWTKLILDRKGDKLVQMLEPYTKEGDEFLHTFRILKGNDDFMPIKFFSRCIGEFEGSPVLAVALYDVSDVAAGFDAVGTASDRMLCICAKSDGVMLHASKSFCEFFNTMPNEHADVNGIDEILKELDPNTKEAITNNLLEEIDKSSVLFYIPSKDKYFEVTVRSIVWFDVDSYILYIEDVTQKKKIQDEQVKLYNDNLGAIVRLNTDAVRIFHVNLTQNDICLVLQDSTQELTNPDTANYDEHMRRTSLMIPDVAERRKFCNSFGRNNLLQLYKTGYYSNFCSYTYAEAPGKEVIHETGFRLFKNPTTGDIEGVACITDVTEERLNSQISQYITENGYDSIGIIKLRDNAHVPVSFNLQKTISEQATNIPNYDYTVARVIFANQFVAEEDREHYLLCSSIERIRKELEANKSYSFNVHCIADGVKKLEKYTYNYLDRKSETVICFVENITSELEIDPLTGVYNFRGFLNRAKDIIKEYKEGELSIVFYNIKSFKAINDIIGTDGGDEILKVVSNKLNDSTLKPLLVGRVTMSDHFLCLVENDKLELHELVKMCNITYDYKRVALTIHGRCGIYEIDDTSLSVNVMCDMAKLARSNIADEYVKPYEFFNETMRNIYISKTETLSLLDEAIGNEEFKVYYQPIYEAATGKIVSAEALVRWIKSDKGLVRPDIFVPTLEENGYISKVDFYVEKRVKKLLTERIGKFSVPISVNLSRMDFYDKTMINTIIDDTKELIDMGIIPRYEITESAWNNMGNEISERMKELSKLGCKFLLDDFGSGYSSFSTLKDYDFDIIKIDMGFVQNLGKSVKVMKIVRSIIDMAHSMDTKVVAEGAETEEQVGLLTLYGCDYIQGFYFSKPLPEKDFIKLLDEQRCIL